MIHIGIRKKIFYHRVCKTRRLFKLSELINYSSKMVHILFCYIPLKIIIKVNSLFIEKKNN
jgi:hypothetical protein